MRILFLDIDTLRPDHLGCYGYHRNTSPAIDSVANEGLRFTNYYCPDAPCLPSRTALMTGRFGIHTGVVGHGGTAADMRLEGTARDFRDRLAEESLPAVLAKAGLKTVTISPFAERHSAWHFYAGFAEMHNTGSCGMESAEEITPTALKWIKANAAEDDWFLHVNYWDPHTPYRAPEAFGNPFEDEPLPDWPTAEALARHRETVGPHHAREIAMFDNRTNPRYPRHPGELCDMDDLRRMIDGYDCGIRYVDSHVERLLAALGEEGVLDDLAIIISSDHGENMGEFGIYGEHATADHATCRMPMIFKWHGGCAGTDDGLRYNLDLAPTLAELLEVPAPESWDGESYAQSVMDGAKGGREYLVLSQCAHVCQRSVRMGDWLYMRTWHDGYHLFPDEMLFELAADPYEQVDLSSARGDVRKEMATVLERWRLEMMASSPSDVDPMQTVLSEGGPYHARGNLKRYAEYLERTDRAWAVAELKERHPREFE